MATPRWSWRSPQTAAGSRTRERRLLRRLVENEDLEAVVRAERDLAVVADHLPAGEPLDRLGGRLGHDLLKAQPELTYEHVLAGLQECLLVAREAALQDAEDVVVVDVRLRLGRALAVEAFLQAHHRVRDLAAKAGGDTGLDAVRPVALGQLRRGGRRLSLIQIFSHEISLPPRRPREPCVPG